MGVDAKEIGLTISKILGFSMNTTLRFIQNHPVFSGVIMFLFTLYICFPSVFYILIYSSPVIASLVVFVLNKLNLKRIGSQRAEEKPSSSSESKNSGGNRNVVRSHLRHQRSVRRNARRKVEEWDSQASEEEENKVILTSLYNDLLGRTPHFDDSPKAVETDIDKNKASPRDYPPQKLENSGLSYCGLAVLDSGKPANGDCEKEGKGVDSQEDVSDQKNSVVDHGISEMERHRRLESLIARRRARRLFKLALDQKNMMNLGEKISPVQNIPHISLSKNNWGFLGVNHNNSSDDVRGLQTPGSAPSVLLPSGNPFDIPYDPQEERPNLTGDSFDEEFAVITQKDILFSRHESFCRPCLISPKPMHDSNGLDSSSNVERTINRTRSETINENETQAEQEVPREGELATTENNVEEENDRSVESGKHEAKIFGKKQVTEVEEQLETDSNKEDDDGGSSSSAESEQEFNSLNQAELKEAIRHTMAILPGPFRNQARNSIPSPLPRGIPPRIEDHHLFYAGKCTNSHARTFSIASDLQVEVSEMSSPPTTVDGHDDSSNDGESYMYDTDIDREIAHQGELQKQRLRQFDLKPRTGVIGKEQNGSAESSMVPVSQFMQVDDQPKEVEDEAFLSREGNTEEHVKQAVQELNVQKPFNFSDAFPFTNSGKLQLGEDTIHKSISLSSIAEERDTIIDSMDGGKQVNVKQVVEEPAGQRQCLSSPDSSAMKLVSDEADMQDLDRCENEEFHGLTEKINPEAIEYGDKVMEEEKKQNFGDHTTEEHSEKLSNNNRIDNGSNSCPATHYMNLVQESKSREAIDGQSASEINHNLSDSSATLAQSIEPLLDKKMTKDGVFCSKTLDSKAANIESKPIEQAQMKTIEDERKIIVKNTNKEAENLPEHEDCVPNAFSGYSYTESLEARKDVEQPGEVIVSQVNEGSKDAPSLPRLANPLAKKQKQEDNSQRFNDLNEQETLEKLNNDTQPVQEYSSKNNVEESAVSEDIRNSNDSIFMTNSAKTPSQQVLPSSSLGLSSPVEMEKINDSKTEASDKQPPPEQLTTTNIHDKDFKKPEAPSDTHGISTEKEMAENSYGMIEPVETTDHSDVHETQENKEDNTNSYRVSSERSDLGNCDIDSSILERRDEDQAVAEEDITKEPKPGGDIASNVVKDITGYSRELTESETMDASTEVNDKKEEDTLISVDQEGDAAENISFWEKDELRNKSDPLYSSKFVNAREDSDEPRKQIEAKKIAEASKEADIDDTTKTAKDKHQLLDL